jgi:ATP-dependent DNA helicase PIF1
VKATNSENPEDPGEDSVKKCRFHFPRHLRDEAVVDKSVNPKHFMFSAARNHDHLNNYNPLLTMAWLANTDVSPVTSIESVLNYVGKYATKEENQPRIRIY